MAKEWHSYRYKTTNITLIGNWRVSITSTIRTIIKKADNFKSSASKAQSKNSSTTRATGVHKLIYLRRRKKAKYVGK
ncbi:hypothetical protein T03_7255 [Trichinella britovi]|uniref:Uncharacterized protein n=2 Tax=Trichinella TaxID=6333 RepID=A0A0V1DFE0_TRIBR|nr:hypothetical protein T05_10018 [Trichinella murrelli]KRY60075.1 hypothetical protein T03_7255 [Trichinella britovi]